jgi:amino acid adenylation domain-containing protein
MDIGISLLDEEQFNRIVYEWNRTGHEYPADKTVAELFEEQVERTPENIAVVYGGKRLSYRELNGEANRLARYLVGEYGVGPDDLVALCLDRSELMEVAILGVLKAGGAYVPMGADYPVERIKYLLEDTKAKAVLTNGIYEGKLKEAGAGGRIESIDREGFRERMNGESAENLGRRAGPKNLAYVIYTSGTTGEPKGVMLEHRGLVNRVWWMNGEYPLDERDAVLQKTPYTFDVSVWELTWALLFGARIVFAKPDGHKDSEYLIEEIEREGVTVIHFVPSMLRAFEETAGSVGSGRCGSLRYLFCSGEALGLREVEEWRRLFPHAKIHNLYGPTEASIDVLYYDCNADGLNEVLIGKPIWNTGVYILDKGLGPVPVGAVGELYIGGVGVARGYLNKPGLTAEKFIGNPFQTEEEEERGCNGVLYKTGDIAIYRADGNIEYLGRNDFQVKIHGFRIELGEIENALLKFPGIRQCVVMAKERGGGKYLAAWYVSNGDIDTRELESSLEGKLPKYMIPDVFIKLEKFPVTVNGKLDHRALPDPEIKTDEGYEKPANEVEEKLRGLYAEVLGIPEEGIGVHTDFFRIGGDSIRSIRLVNRIQRHLRLPVTIADILKLKTVRKLYKNVLSGSKTTKTIQNEQGKLSGSFPLLPSQQYLFDMMETHNAPQEYYNNYISTYLVEIKDADEEVLVKSLTMLAEYHDAFRLKYEKTADTYIQYYSDTLPEIKFHTLAENSDEREMEINRVLTGWIKPINIFSGKLAVFGIVTGFEDKHAQVYLLCHHLNTDGVSWRIVGDDLKAVYSDLVRRREQMTEIPVEEILGPKGTSLRQWSTALLAYKEQAKDEKTYWEDTERAAIVSNQVIAGLSSGVMKNRPIDIGEELTEKILTASRRGLETRIDDILLSALNMALHKMSGPENQCIMMESHGRHEVHGELDVSRTMGWFALPYPVKLPPLGEDAGETIERVKESLRKIPNGGIGYRLLCRGDRGRYMPKIYFNYQGEFENRIDVDVDLLEVDEIFQYDMELIGHVFKQRLRFVFMSKLGDDKASRFVRDFEDSLHVVVGLVCPGPTDMV